MSCRAAPRATCALPAPGDATQESVLNGGVRLQDCGLIGSASDTLELKSPSGAWSRVGWFCVVVGGFAHTDVAYTDHSRVEGNEGWSWLLGLAPGGWKEQESTWVPLHAGREKKGTTVPSCCPLPRLSTQAYKEPEA